jgi:membrane protease YdiL (CAAX protease family)
VENVMREVFRRVRDTEALLFLVLSAIAEEVFFRLAVQDALGLAGSVAVYVLLNSSVGGVGVIPYTFVHALGLGLLVQQGFGLLGSTTAHAIMNYLSLRRILCA